MTDEIESKITDEHRAMIGEKSDPATFVIKQEDARRVRDLLGDNDPRWADGTGMAPPYVLAMHQNVQGRTRMPRILPGGIMTQQEWRFTRPFKIGESLKSVNQLIDIRDRLGGRYGYSVLLTTSTDFFDADEQNVASILISITQFDPQSARGSE